MATGERRDPFRAYNFQLEIDNIARGAFSDLYGVSSGHERHTVRLPCQTHCSLPDEFFFSRLPLS